MSGNEAVQRLARTHHLSDRRVFDILKRQPVASVNVGDAVQLNQLGGEPPASEIAIQLLPPKALLYSAS